MTVLNRISVIHIEHVRVEIFYRRRFSINRGNRHQRLDVENDFIHTAKSLLLYLWPLVAIEIHSARNYE